MARGSRFKLLSTERPIDKFNFLNTLGEDFTYCFKSDRVRSKGTGKFQKDRLRYFRPSDRKKRIIQEVVSVFFNERDLNKLRWYEISVRRKQEKYERQVRTEQRKKVRNQKRLITLLEKGHKVENGRLTKNFLLVKHQSRGPNYVAR